jgi:hypothetical protein
MADVAERIEESGRRIGHHVWVEARLFEVIGRWSGTVDDPRARALFGSESRHHAWHVQLWHELLPALPHVGPSQLVAPAGPEAEMIAALEALDDSAEVEGDGPAAGTGGTGGADGGDAEADADRQGDPGAVARLAALVRDALPALERTYEEHLARTTPLTDGPTVRVLRLVLADLAEDRAAGEALLDTLTPTQPG